MMIGHRIASATLLPQSPHIFEFALRKTTRDELSPIARYASDDLILID